MLQEIGLKYGTDKATYHEYLDYYERMLDRNAKKFLEIGVLNGASLRMWREWFGPDTIVEGWDIERLPMVNGCFVAQVDQTNRNDMRAAASGIYDIILDDGAHTVASMETSFSFLFPYTKTYVIEDLHAPYMFDGYARFGEPYTADSLEVLRNYGVWDSEYATDEEREYIKQNALVYPMFWRGNRNKPQSMTCIIENRKNNGYKD